MAINKNFVIKNGLEVNTNVLVAASDESQVGVGTTRPYYKLHVGGGEGNRGGIGATDITITGIATIGVANSSSGAFRVLGISTFQGDLDLLGSAGVSTVRWDASKDALTFVDNASIRLGTGEDLRIWHDGSNSYISDQGDGSLIIYGTDETLAVFTDDGSVQLYNNDSKKLETTGLGITVYGDTVVAGVTTSARLKVTGISTFSDDVIFDGAGANITFDRSTDDLIFDDNTKAIFGSSSDGLEIYHDGSHSFLENTGTGNLILKDSGSVWIRSADFRVQNAGGTESLIVGSADGALGIFYDATERLSTTAIGATVFGDFIASGVGTFARAYVSGIATFASDVNVQGNLNVTGDITYDEITGRNLNITGITTLADQVNFGASGAASTIAKNGNATFSGIVTASQFQGGGIGVGIGSTTAHVGYGFTYLDLKGPGVSTVYASATTGITTIYFQGGGGSSVGAAGTWQNDGTQGISTAKNVGINTVGVAVTALQGGQKGGSSGIGASAYGAYIGNGMIITDNVLNGDHYIGTAFNGLMAGPVTVNGYITVDGNWAVV